jgi:hypothetical protein
MALRDAVIDLEDRGWFQLGSCRHRRANWVVADMGRGPVALADGVATRASDLDHVLRHFDLSLSVGYLAEWDKKEPLWRVLRFCPDDRPPIISIQSEGEGIGSRRTAGGWPTFRRMADGSSGTTMVCTPTRWARWCGWSRGGVGGARRVKVRLVVGAPP